MALGRNRLHAQIHALPIGLRLVGAPDDLGDLPPQAARETDRVSNTRDALINEPAGSLAVEVAMNIEHLVSFGGFAT